MITNKKHFNDWFVNLFPEIIFKSKLVSILLSYAQDQLCEIYKQIRIKTNYDV